MLIGFADVFFSVLSVFIIKFMDPNAVAIRTVFAIVRGKKKVRFQASEFASAVISRNKTVFERLAEM